MPDDPKLSPRLLLVEDEALIRMVVVETLKDDGWEIAEAATAAEAMMHLQGDGWTFAAAIIDIGLPDHPGDLLAEEIRLAWPDLPIVIATGMGGADLADRFRADARFQVIGKPYSESALYEALSALGVTFT